MLNPLVSSCCPHENSLAFVITRQGLFSLQCHPRTARGRSLATRKTCFENDTGVKSWRYLIFTPGYCFLSCLPDATFCHWLILETFLCREQNLPFWFNIGPPRELEPAESIAFVIKFANRLS